MLRIYMITDSLGRMTDTKDAEIQKDVLRLEKQIHNLSPQNQVEKLNRRLAIKLTKLHFQTAEHAITETHSPMEHTLRQLYVEGLKMDNDCLIAFGQGQVENNAYAQYLYLMAVSAFRLGDVDAAVLYAQNAYSLAESHLIKEQALCEYIVIISCINMRDYSSHIRFLRTAAWLLFLREDSIDATANMFAAMYRHSAGEVKTELIDIFGLLKKRAQSSVLLEKVKEKLEKTGHGHLASKLL